MVGLCHEMKKKKKIRSSFNFEIYSYYIDFYSFNFLSDATIDAATRAIEIYIFEIFNFINEKKTDISAN